MKILLLITFVIVSGVSCGGKSTFVFYDGERRPSESVATIDVSMKPIFVMSIDTLTHRYESLDCGSIELLPGEHTIGIDYRSWKGSSVEPILLTFNAEAGHTYTAKVDAGYRQWTAWIVDTANDSTICEHPKALMSKEIPGFPEPRRRP